MKKFLLFICVFSLFLISCKEDDQIDPKDEIITECEKLIPSGGIIRDDVEFSEGEFVKNVWVDFIYESSNQSVLSNEGKVNKAEEDVVVNVVFKYAFYETNGNRYESSGQSITYTILGFNTILEEISQKVSVPSEVSDDIKLPTKIDECDIQWSSNNKCLSNKGKYQYVSEQVNVVLTATFIYQSNGNFYFYDKEYNVLVVPYDDQKCVELVANSITMPEEMSGLKIPYVNSNDYDVNMKWTCDNDLVDENGVIKGLQENTKIIVTCELSKGDCTQNLIFDILVKYYAISHNLVIEANDFDGEFDNTEISDGYLVLKDGYLEGTYVSKEFNVRDFTELIGSWNALTDKDDVTCEYAISVYVNGTWSKYFSYGKWGLGGSNLYYNQTDTYAKMNTDEILVNNNLVGTKVRFMLTLRRSNVDLISPKLSRIAMTFTYDNYEYYVDTTNLPDSVDWDVPKLYQYDVPEIGGSICSATTTTMLLKYYNVDVSSDYEYEHEYMASLVADRGHNNPTYGNWSYNMATAGAFGRVAYVARLYSFDELRSYLVNGPVGASIKGTFTSINGSSYSTSGHLIVVRGYRIENGKTIVICNDPAVKGTYYEVYLSTFMQCWRNVIYVVK